MNVFMKRLKIGFVAGRTTQLYVSKQQSQTQKLARCASGRIYLLLKIYRRARPEGPVSDGEITFSLGCSDSVLYLPAFFTDSHGIAWEVWLSGKTPPWLGPGGCVKFLREVFISVLVVSHTLLLLLSYWGWDASVRFVYPCHCGKFLMASKWLVWRQLRTAKLALWTSLGWAVELLLLYVSIFPVPSQLINIRKQSLWRSWGCVCGCGCVFAITDWLTLLCTRCSLSTSQALSHLIFTLSGWARSTAHRRYACLLMCGEEGIPGIS